MTTTIRPARGGKGWEYDIRFRWPEGGRFRERANAPVSSKTAATRWALAREATVLGTGRDALAASKVSVVAVEVVTLAVFWPRFVQDHYRANRKKPSTIDAAEAIYRRHLAPTLAARRLTEISNSDVATLKGGLAERAPKTVNNILSVLSRALHSAVDWGVIGAVPCKIDLLNAPKTAMAWHELHEYRRLVDAAAKLGTSWLVLVLLAGSAGLRRGEIRALKWSDLDLPRQMIKIDRAYWRLDETDPKGGRGRFVPMTPELAAALTKHRHVRGVRVLYNEKGCELSNRSVRNMMASVQRRAGLEATGAIHVLRHTFCSHLAAASVPAKAIQELAGHADLSTTQRYMHLAPGDRGAAMSALTGYYAGVRKTG